MKNTITLHEKALDHLHSTHFGLNFSKYKAVISGNVKEEYHFEKSVHYGGALKRHQKKKFEQIKNIQQ